MPKGVYRDYVKDRTNIAELVTYGIYKEWKLAEIERKISEKEAPLDENTIRDIRNSMSSKKAEQTQIANTLLSNFLNAYMAEHIPLVIKASQPSLSTQLLIGSISSALGALLILILAILFAVYRKIDIIKLIFQSWYVFDFFLTFYYLWLYYYLFINIYNMEKEHKWQNHPSTPITESTSTRATTGNDISKILTMDDIKRLSKKAVDDFKATQGFDPFVPPDETK